MAAFQRRTPRRRSHAIADLRYQGYDQAELLEAYNRAIDIDGADEDEIIQLFGKGPYEFRGETSVPIPIYGNLLCPIYTDKQCRLYYHYYKSNPAQLIVKLPISITRSRNQQNKDPLEFPHEGERVLLLPLDRSQTFYATVTDCEDFQDEGRPATALVTFNI